MSTIIQIQGDRPRKSTFAKRQKTFVRNFLTDQLSMNQYFLFPGNKNPLNSHSLKLETQKVNDLPFLKRYERMHKVNMTACELNRKNGRKTSESMRSSYKSAPNFISSREKNKEEGHMARLPSIANGDFIKELKKTDHIERDLILNSEIKKLKEVSLSNTPSYISRSKKFFIENEEKSMEERAKILNRFRKAVKKIIICLSCLEIHKLQMQRMLLKQSETWIHKSYMEVNDLMEKNDMFDKNYYSRPREPKFPDEAKRFLQLDPNDRTDEMIRFITLSLNFCVPEFLTFPVHMQRKIAQLSFYQEFEPSRVIMRQGHMPCNYYIVLSGTLMIAKASLKSASQNQLQSNLKRGDCYGEQDIIKNQLRAHTITVYGNTPCGLLQIEKEDFYAIQTPTLSPEARFNFLLNKVNFFKIINYPVAKLNNLPRTSCFSIFYRTGQTICEDSVKDDWIYIIKSGSARVLKKVRFDNNALSFFHGEGKSKRQIMAEKEISLVNADNCQKLPQQYIKSGSKFIVKPSPNQKVHESIDYPKSSQYTYLEMKKLVEGEIFGIHDLVFTDPKEVSSNILVSDGAECIHIRRFTFMDICDGEALLRMKFNLPPFPNNESFILKYFSYLEWGNYKHKLDNKTTL